MFNYCLRIKAQPVQQTKGDEEVLSGFLASIAEEEAKLKVESMK